MIQFVSRRNSRSGLGLGENYFLSLYLIVGDSQAQSREAGIYYNNTNYMAKEDFLIRYIYLYSLY